MAAAKNLEGRTTTTSPETQPDPVTQEEQAVPVLQQAKQDLPALMGLLITQVLRDKTQLNRAYSALSMWYDSQDTDDRKALIQTTRKELESVKMIAEALYGHFIMASQKDL